MIFVYAAPTCGKTFTIDKLTGRPEICERGFPTIAEMIEEARENDRHYRDHVLLDTDWLFPYAIRRKIGVTTPLEAWAYWRRTNDVDVQRFVINEFVKLDDPNCVVLTNLHLWEFGVDVHLRYARSPSDLETHYKARDVIRNRKYGLRGQDKLPAWVSNFQPPEGSIILPAQTHIYPRILHDLQEVSNAFALSDEATGDDSKGSHLLGRDRGYGHHSPINVNTQAKLYRLERR